MIRGLAGLVATIGVAYGAVPAAPMAVAPAARAAIAREARHLLAQPGVAHVGFYGFMVNRAGHVVREWVVRPSGSSALDRLALASIGKAILKQLPKGAPAMMQFVVPIEFHRGGRMVKPPSATPAP